MWPWTCPKPVRLDDVSIHKGTVGYIGDTPLFIKMAVTHFVDDSKMRKLRERGVSTIKLDFSDHGKVVWTLEELKCRLFDKIKGNIGFSTVKPERQAGIDHAERAVRVAPMLWCRALDAEEKSKDEPKFCR